MSRSEESLKQLTRQIEKEHKVETKIVVADFSDNTNMDYYRKISEKVEDLDIGLLVVNAGVAYDGRFEHTDP